MKIGFSLLVPTILLAQSVGVAQITQIIDSTGNGVGAALDGCLSIAVDASGDAYVTGRFSDNAFKITDPCGAGTVTEIINAAGAGIGATLDFTNNVAVDDSGNVYVIACQTDNVFKISPGGTVTQIMNSTGDGMGNPLDCPAHVAVDAAGNVYVTGSGSDNAFKITDPCGARTITAIITSSGDGINGLDLPRGIAVDDSGNVYVAGGGTDNLFWITPSGVITQIMDSTGDGLGNTLDLPGHVTIDDSGDVYVGGNQSDNAFRISDPTGTPTITAILDATGDGSHALAGTNGIAVDALGHVFVAGGATDNVFKIDPGGAISQILDGSGDGAGNALDGPIGVVVDVEGRVYVTGFGSDNAFKVELCRAETSGVYCTSAPTTNGTSDISASLLEVSISSPPPQFELWADDLPLLNASCQPGPQPGVFVAGPGKTALPFFNGTLCVDPAGLQRLCPLLFPDPAGVVHLPVDLATQAQVPASAPNCPGAPVNVVPCFSYNFQYWTRDPCALMNGSSSSANFSSAVSICFTP